MSQDLVVVGGAAETWYQDWKFWFGLVISVGIAGFNAYYSFNNDIDQDQAIVKSSRKEDLADVHEETETSIGKIQHAINERYAGMRYRLGQLILIVGYDFIQISAIEQRFFKLLLGVVIFLSFLFFGMRLHYEYQKVETDPEDEDEVDLVRDGIGDDSLGEYEWEGTSVFLEFKRMTYIQILYTFAAQCLLTLYFVDTILTVSEKHTFEEAKAEGEWTTVWVSRWGFSHTVHELQFGANGSPWWMVILVQFLAINQLGSDFQEKSKLWAHLLHARQVVKTQTRDGKDIFVKKGIDMYLRCFLHLCTDGVMRNIFLFCAPVLLMSAESPIEYLKDAFAVFFVATLDDIASPTLNKAQGPAPPIFAQIDHNDLESGHHKTSIEEEHEDHEWHEW